MNQPQCQYVDSAFGSTANRNKVIRLADVGRLLPTDRREVYLTWHRFPEAYLQHWTATNSRSVRGYDGTSYADFLPLDFDGQDIAAVYHQVRDFVAQLETIYGADTGNGVRLYWSGGKGFHVLLDAALFGGWTPHPALAGHLKQLATRLIGDRPGFDSSIYDVNRLLRLPNTLHGGSGLWKVPLTRTELFDLSVEGIRTLAIEPREVAFPTWGDCLPAQGLVDLWQAVRQPAQVAVPPAEVGRFVLFPRGMKEGEGRDNQAFAIARFCRKHGWPQVRTLELLALWNEAQHEPLAEAVLAQKAASTYRMAEETPVETPVLNAQELADAYGRHVAKLQGRRIALGLPRVDERIRCIVPGEVCTLIARSGVGKTMLAQNIVRNICRASPEIVSLFASLEQPDSMVFERYAQMALEEPGSVVEREWQQSDANRMEIRGAVIELLGTHAYTAVQGLGLDGLHRVVGLTRERASRPVDVLVVDYLGLIQMGGMGRSLYEQVSTCARALKQFAKEQDLSLILLCQVGRLAGEDGSEPLTTSSARESGAVEESADVLLGLYRPFLHRVDSAGNDIDTYVSVQILKNRKGPEGETFDYRLDRRSLRITGDGELVREETPATKTTRTWPPTHTAVRCGNAHANNA